VLAGNSAALEAFYSAEPPAKIATLAGKKLSGAEEAKFWAGLKSSGLVSVSLELVGLDAPRDDVAQAVFQMELRIKAIGGMQKRYISGAQTWVKRGETWQIVETKRTDLARLKQPLTKSANIYPPGVNADYEIKEALARAAKAHKRVLLDFGANWCYDCHVLDAAFHSPEIAAALNASYEVVHVDVGEYDKNLDIMKRYEVPKDKGIPAMAVLESDGKLLFSQKNGEFESARSLGPEDLLGFLNRWKPHAGGK
jgi:thioredoxin 1